MGLVGPVWFTVTGGIRRITINQLGTYAKAQLPIGFDLKTLLPDGLFASDTRPEIPVRLSVIAGISARCPMISRENQLVRGAEFHRYHRNEAILPVTPRGPQRG